MVTVNCLIHSFLFMDVFADQLKMHEEYTITRINDCNFNVKLFIANQIVRLIVTNDFKKQDIDVCLVCYSISQSTFIGFEASSNSTFIDMAHQAVKYCQMWFPAVPIIISCDDVEVKHEPDELKRAALAGRKIFNRQMGDELANKVGAVKYVPWSRQSGKGTKFLFDEIAFAGLGKLKDKNEENMKWCTVA